MNDFLLIEQERLRHLQTRPQVLVYFDRLPVLAADAYLAQQAGLADDREILLIVITHFGGGPTLDVQFAFSPALVNHREEEIGRNPPFSTGIAVMPPGDSIMIPFDDFHKYEARAGLTRAVPRTLDIPIDPLPLKYRAVVSLRDPIGDDPRYKTEYDLDLSHLMSYTMDPVNRSDKPQPY